MESKVSIWMGLFEGEEEFQKYTSIDYTVDGDSIPSEFEKEFDLEYYDRALVEKKYIYKTSNIEKLFNKFSYSDSFQKNDLIVKQEYNSIILIYDIENVIDNTNILKDKTMDYMGEIIYEKIVEDKW